MAITTGRMNSDRISNLPDPILHDILGLLKPKEAVQTCVLSKRWKNLWTCLSSLDFNPADFTRKRYPAAVSHVWFADQVAGYERFVEFVSVFLFCCNHLLVLDKFQLSCQHNQISKLIFGKSVLEHARDWIRYAVRHNPRVLSLHFVLSRNSLSDIYTCMSVQELHLHECEVDVSGIVNLPSLRKLSFSKVDFILSNLKNILSGCPILEYLSLECCIWDESEIAHRSLQHLTIVSCTCAREIPRMFISAPNLLSFCYKWSPSKITLNVPSLTDARFIFPNSTAVWRGWKELAASLSALVNVEILEFELWAFWHDYRSQKGEVLPELPLYQKLQDCSIRAPFSACCGFRLVTWILASSSNLRKLSLQEHYTCVYFINKREVSTSESNDALRVAISQCKSLEFVEVKYCKCSQMVRWLRDALFEGTTCNNFVHSSRTD